MSHEAFRIDKVENDEQRGKYRRKQNPIYTIYGKPAGCKLAEVVQTWQEISYEE